MSKLHSVRLNKDLCVGCTNCIKKCPTEAIRVRNGKARISEARCIDCGECIKACPHHAKSAVMDSFALLLPFKHKVALAAPSLYAQFGAPATRAMVLASVLNIGFDDVYEVAIGADIVTRNSIELLNEARKQKRLPLISSACPAVVRLIQMKYPGLLDNLVPFDSPMEVTADLARQEAMARTGLSSHEIGIFFLSPCPAKRTAVTNPIRHNTTNIDGVISFADAYPLILSKLEKLDPATVAAMERRALANPDGVRWGFSGGESVGLKTEKYLAVDGIHNVIAILEEIENERLRDVEFIEANSCMGGCIGGPLTVANRYSAQSRYTGHVRAAEELQRNEPGKVYEPANSYLAAWPESPEPNDALKLDPNIMLALQKYERMEKIVRNLPGLDCGACGAPDCAALAEDIVRGEATETDCIFKLKERIRRVASEMVELEIQMTRAAPQTEAERADPD